MCHRRRRKGLLGPSGWLIVHSHFKGGISHTWTAVGQFDAPFCKLVDLGKSPLKWVLMLCNLQFLQL